MYSKFGNKMVFFEHTNALAKMIVCVFTENKTGVAKEKLPPPPHPHDIPYNDCQMKASFISHCDLSMLTIVVLVFI